MSDLARKLLRALLPIAVATVALASLAVPAEAASLGAGSDSMAVNHHSMAVKAAHSARPSRSSNLYYHGGKVETAPAVYVVYWGWTSDPSGEQSYYNNFLNHVGGSPWLNSVTQYCQGVTSGTTQCGSQGQHAGNPSGLLKGTWSDNVNSIPSSPSQSDLAAEATRAAAHFGNTTSASNVNAQYVIATPHGNNSSGFGSSYCAWHAATASQYGTLAYTNLPYITDAGASCGESSVNTGSAGLLDGVSIVGGHELAESVSDPGVSSSSGVGGWLDGRGSENGDKCAWMGLANVNLSGASFPVQPLWSNAANGGNGGCVLSY